MLEYHAALIADEVRTNAFIEALKFVIRPGARVLDVGTGTGILSVVAAKLGADVIAIEESDMVEYARMVASANNVEIRFIAKNMLHIEDDEIEPVDIIVSEMIGNTLLDEAIIPVIESARRFLKTGGVVIPRSIGFSAALVHSDLIEKTTDIWRQRRYEIDFSPLADCMENMFFSDRLKPSQIMGLPSSFPEIDLAVASGTRYSESVTLSADTAGEYNAVLTWWRAHLAGEIRLSQDPVSHWHRQHWHRTLFPVRPRRIVKGETVLFKLTHDASSARGIWTWSIGDDHRSTFFSIPPTKDRMSKFL